MSALPRVSVLLPAWNAERHLARAIESVLAQTFADFELLVVDDASDDGTGAVVRSFRDPRIRRVANEKNLGVTRSLNRGLALARAAYVARMDADDLCAPERLARQVAFLDDEPRAALVATRARRIDAHGVEIGVFDTPTDGGALRRRLRIGNCIVHGSVMMRAEPVRALGGYDESMERAQDYDLWLRLCERHAVAALPDRLYAWRETDSGVGSRHPGEQERFAERARLAARQRFVAAIVEEVAAGQISSADATRRVRDQLWEEHEMLARRASWLVAHWHSLRQLGPRVAIRRALDACAAGQRGAAETRTELFARLVALDPVARALGARLALGPHLVE